MHVPCYFTTLGWLDCGKLSASVSTVLQPVCKEWGSGGVTHPMTDSVGSKYTVSVHAIKSSRRKMEDRHECCVNVNPMFGLEVQLET